MSLSSGMRAKVSAGGPREQPARWSHRGAAKIGPRSTVICGDPSGLDPVLKKIFQE
jgi:hypothetical protein